MRFKKNGGFIPLQRSYPTKYNKLLSYSRQERRTNTHKVDAHWSIDSRQPAKRRGATALLLQKPAIFLAGKFLSPTQAQDPKL